MPNRASCDVPLLEGENNFTFWALSSWGDSSRMGSLSARVDTLPPQIEGSLSGTPGEAGWYVSPVTLSASASDPQPGSGIDTFTYTLNASPAQPYTGPITLGDGMHTLTFRAQDLAGHVSEISQRVQVDTLPPQVNVSLAGEQANGWYLSQVTFTAAASDDGSGLARIEYALDGASWQAYHMPVTIGDGIHTLRLRAFDLAGNQAEAAPLTFQVDGTPPHIQLSDNWYIWESGEVNVRDGQSGLSGVEIEIRDPQGRWQEITRAYEANGLSFTTNITWDRRFGDGTLAPVGTYQVLVKAFDRAGNFARQTASIHIPAPNAPTRRVEPAETYTPTAAPTALPTLTLLPSLTPDTSPLATKTAIPTRTPVVSAFQSPNLQSNNLQSHNLQSNNLLWGAAALTAIAGATGLALAARRRRKEEEERQAAEVRAQAEAKTEALRRQKEQQRLLERIQNYLLSQQMKKAQEAAARQAQYRAMDAKIEREEQKEEAAWEAWKSRSETLAAQRAEQQRQQTAAAYQAYRQGEWEGGKASVSNPNIPPWRKTLSSILAVGALALDVTSLAISTTGTLVEMAFTALGLVEPSPGGGEAVGFVAGASVYNKVLNPIENWISLRSAILVTTSDILAGNTRFEKNTPFAGVQATELIIGQDTLVAWGGIAFGNTPLTPEAFTDTAVNAAIVFYDVQRLTGQIPTSLECRIGRTNHGTLYMRCTSPER